ncbi:MAG: insulinase family protein [Prevotella sp.]|nr:insulinase family protein [Prevotella sp.]
MRYNTHTLRCGLRIIHQPVASSVVYCGYAINAGSRDEEADSHGLAHFCEHMTFKGTARRRSWHILNTLERVGGDLNAFTNKEDTVYHAAILAEHLPRAVDLLTDIVFHSQYPQTEIDKEATVICEEIESYNDTPAELIYDEFDNKLFDGHPLGHHILGSVERVRSFTTADAQRFTKMHYRAENMVFFASGDISFDRLVRLLERATNDLPEATPDLPDREAKAAALAPFEACTLHVHRDTHQAHVLLGTRGYSVHHPLRMSLYLLNNMMGGPGMNSRLNLALRERRGLVYTVESSMANYSDTGVWTTYFGCDPHDVQRCLRVVRKEQDLLINSPLTPMQLTAAKRQLKGQIGVACDQRESFTLGLGKTFLHYGWESDPDKLYARIDAITAEQVQQTAQEVFDPDRQLVLCYD